MHKSKIIIALTIVFVIILLSIGSYFYFKTAECFDTDPGGENRDASQLSAPVYDYNTDSKYGILA